MKKCPGENERICYTYGEMPEKEKALFEKHLETCFACKADMASLNNFRAFVKSSLAPENPDENTISAIKEVSYDVLSKINAAARLPRYGWRFAFTAGALGMAAAIFMFLIYVKNINRAILLPVNYDAKIFSIKQKINGVSADIEKNYMTVPDIYESSLSDIKQRIYLLKSELREEI